MLRLRQFGLNELPGSRSRRFLRIFVDVLREPMVYLLLGGGGVYTLLGDRHEAMGLLGFLVLIIGITVYQERKTEKALDALRDLSSPRALVLRDAIQVRIAGIEVVPGDVLFLAEGDRVPADGIVLNSSDLAADESLLTGESVPVGKWKGTIVYAGTTVVRGRGMLEIRATGLETEMGKIGKSLGNPSIEGSRLQKESRALVRILSLYASGLCLFVTLAYVLTRQDWLGGLLAGLSLAMAILPNELPAVLLIFFASGAWRLSGRKVLTRSLPAVETLGSTTVLCVDKTGTLTLNQMELHSLWNGSSRIEVRSDRREPLPLEFHALLEAAILANAPDPFDPMERALLKTESRLLGRSELLHAHRSLVREYPISPKLLSVSYAWRSSGQSEVGTKGAPEAVVGLCRLSESESRTVLDEASRMAGDGLRVLGVARAETQTPLPERQEDLNFTFQGLVGLADPVRDDAPQAVRECSRAGIRVLMMTGDHPETARSIAHQVHLPHWDEVLTGAEIERMEDQELLGHLRRVNVFSRMRPDQKLRLVTLLQAQGEVVGMTGDGVNDAPALKKADIGIAMGKRGTDVAREAASIVLLEDDFSSIVAAIRMGRRVFANMRSAVAYLLAVHVPITLISIVPVFFKLPLVLLPLHIAFLHLIIEPACTIVFEAEAENPESMSVPPRPASERLFGSALIRRSLLQGLRVSAVVLGVFLVSLWRGQGEQDARTLTFTTLLISNFGLIQVNRTSRQSNSALRWIVLGSLLLLGAVLGLTPARELFRFSALHVQDGLICLSAGIFSIAWSGRAR